MVIIFARNEHTCHIVDLLQLFRPLLPFGVEAYSRYGTYLQRFYGLDGPGIESQWGSVSPHPSTPALGPTQFPIQ
jgi:hypothetical protein